MSRRPARSRSPASRVVPCRACGAQVRMVMVIPTRIRPGQERSWMPLDLALPVVVAPSHALSLSRTWCHPITDSWPIEGHEIPSVTHFATCPARSSHPGGPDDQLDQDREDHPEDPGGA